MHRLPLVHAEDQTKAVGNQTNSSSQCGPYNGARFLKRECHSSITISWASPTCSDQIVCVCWGGGGGGGGVTI